MRRARWWLAVAGVLLLLVGGGLAASPALVRWAVASRVRALTGAPVAIADVDVDLPARRVVLAGVRVGAPRPLAGVERVEARLRLGPLLRGRLHLEAVRLAGVRVHVVRAADGTVDAARVLAHLRALPPATAPPALQLDRLELRDGALVVEDRALVPARMWRAEGLRVDARDLGGPEARGTAEATLALAGAPVTVRARAIGLVPLRAHVELAIAGLDLAQFAPYVPERWPGRLRGGRLTSRYALDYDARTGLRADGETRLDALAVAPRQAHAPQLVVPRVAVRATEVTAAAGVWRVGRLSVDAEAALHDARAPGGRWEVRDLRLSAEGVRYPTGPPAPVTLAAALPAGARLTGAGRLALAPLAAEVALTLRDLDARLARGLVPRQAPVALDRGRVHADLTVRLAAGTVELGGDVILADLALGRRGQREPVVTHPRLTASLAGLAYRDGRWTLARLHLAGAPTVVDARVDPPARVAFAALALTLEDAAWPSVAPARVTGRARLRPTGEATLTGRFDLGTLDADVRLTARGLDLTRLAPYLARAPLARVEGRADAEATLVHRGGRVELHARGTLADLGLSAAAGASPALADRRLRVAVDGLVVEDGRVEVRRVQLRGAPALVTADGERVALADAEVLAERLAWPARGPSPVTLRAALPEAGTLAARGRLDLRAGTVDLALDLTDAALGPWRPVLPVDAPIGGSVSAALALRAGADGLHVRGRAEGRELRLGPPEAPPMSVARLEAVGIDARWPARVAVGHVRVERPAVQIVRDPSGEFPLLRMLRPGPDARPTPGARAGPAAGAGARAAGDPAVGADPRGRAPAGSTPPARPAVAVERLEVIEGEGRFIDRSTRPFYSEEVTRLAIGLTGLRSEPGGPADLAIDGIVGGQAALTLRGVVAPFGRPFFLEVEGELRDFAVPRTNPYLRRFLAWIARSGELTTRLHYRIVGDELAGTNQIVVERLAVERAAERDEVGRLLGLPLALIVALLKNPQGEIRLEVPVAGRLGAPEFSFGDAFLTALRNVVVGLVTAPLRLIGRVVQRGETVEEVQVDPVEFAPGAATVSPEAARQLQRVADFLRASPAIVLELRAAVTEADLAALRRQAALARVQEVRRRLGLDEFDAAARAAFRERLPGRPLPPRADEVLAALAEAEPVPAEAAEALARRRVEAARRTLVEAAGIEAERLVAGPPPAALGVPGPPRVEFTIQPG